MAEINNDNATGMTPQPVKKKSSVNVGGSVPLTDILYRTLHYWPWLLLSVCVFVGGGIIYLLRTPNVYSRSASILIKEDDKGKSSVGTEDFADLGLFQSNTNIQNEMMTLRSTTVMEEVVKRLNLDVNYFRNGTFHKNVAYGDNLPVKVTFIDYPDAGSASFSLEVLPDSTVSISEFVVGASTFDKELYTGHLGDTINTPVGGVEVAVSPYYIKGSSVNLEVVKIPLEWATKGYQGGLAVSLSNEKSSVINLSITDQAPQRAEDILNTLIGVYNENWIREKNQIAVSTSNFINERLGVIERELGHVDSDISSYKSEHLIPDVGAASSMYMTQSQQNAQEILNLNNQLQMTRYIRSYLTSDANRNQILPSNSGVENVNIQSQIDEYNDKILQRNNLISKSSEKNPIVKQLDEQLASLRSAIVASVDNSIISLNTQIKNLQGAQAATTSKIASNPLQSKYLLSVERQQKVKESLYLFLLQKREENELSQAFTAYNTRIVERPGGSMIPTLPNRRNILLICFMLGICLPFGVVYVKETYNTKLRGRRDVEALVTPFLGEIPQCVVPKGGDENRVVVVPGCRDVINEAFRVLRTNLEFMRVNRDGANVIAVTSFNPGSGKSFMVMNLAASLAVKERRVLVIDGDMRHGTTSSFVGSPRHGLADWLSGVATDVKNMIVSLAGYDRVSVLPVGTMPPNPTELLETPRFEQLVQMLKGDYDYIFIDCPPVEVVADTRIIDRCVDRTIFVIRAGLLERSMLPELDNLYLEKKYRNMAFILNGTRNDQGRYGYSHSYQYGYGYGYGYGYHYGNDDKSGSKDVVSRIKNKLK